MLVNKTDEQKSGADFEQFATGLMGKFTIGYFINPGKRYEDVYELLKKSAIAYKLENSWEKAGDVYLKASQYISTNPYDELFSVGTRFEMVDCLINGAYCYDKIKHGKRITCRTNAIAIHKIVGNFDRCAKLQMEIANIYELDDQLTKSIESYLQAHQFFELDGKSRSSSIHCLCKYVDLYIKIGQIDFNNLVNIYSKIIDYYQSEKLGKYQLKQYIMMILITIMCITTQTIESIKTEYEQFVSLDYSFSTSSQGILINGLIGSIANNDVELFETSCYNYDRVKPLDPSMVSLLTIVKKRISTDEPDDEVDIC